MPGSSATRWRVADEPISAGPDGRAAEAYWKQAQGTDLRYRRCRISIPEAVMPATAEVFTSGCSQATRIPKNYCFNCDKITVERDGGRLILTPKRVRRHVSWAAVPGADPRQSAR